MLSLIFFCIPRLVCVNVCIKFISLHMNSRTGETNEMTGCWLLRHMNEYGPNKTLKVS